ncbi:nucleotidyltransferase domain-containing protein [Candidatus Woesearchaeota archaeon]|nr:nucleotidyltransferase domain-containing protein [Candidatus Woesearchaeota archaeon]
MLNKMTQLNELFGEKNFVRLFFFFLEHPTSEVSQKELKEKLKMAKNTLIKWLDMLEKKELIVKKQKFPKKYILNRENSIIKHLKSLNNILKLEKIKELSKKRNIQIYLYGSSARGEDTEDSDIDLLVIGKTKKEDIIQDINLLSEKIKRRISISIFSPLQWSAMAEKDKAFYERVEKDKILI